MLSKYHELLLPYPDGFSYLNHFKELAQPLNFSH